MNTASRIKSRHVSAGLRDLYCKVPPLLDIQHARIQKVLSEGVQICDNFFSIFF